MVVAISIIEQNNKKLNIYILDYYRFRWIEFYVEGLLLKIFYRNKHDE